MLNNNIAFIIPMRDKLKKKEYDAKRWLSHKDKISENHNEWRLNNLAKRAATTRASNRKKWDYVNSFKDKPCANCNQQFPPYCMDFHHKDSETKSFNLGLAHTKSYAKIDEEIAKCVLLCAICHRKYHNGDLLLE